MVERTGVQYDWVLFDADNTIFDFHASSEIAFHKSFEHHGISSGKELYKSFKRINLAAWRAFDENRMSHHDIKEYRFSTLFQQYEYKELDPLEFNALYFRNLVDNIRYIDGAVSVLKNLSECTKLAIITNGMKEVQRPRLEASDIHDLFDLIVVSGEIGFSKPNHAFFKYVFDRIDGHDKSRVLVVGDNLLADVKGGLDFGFKTAWYNPYGITKENGIIPDFEIEYLDQIMGIVLKDHSSIH